MHVIYDDDDDEKKKNHISTVLYGRDLEALDCILSLHFNGHFPGEPGLAGAY